MRSITTGKVVNQACSTWCNTLTYQEYKILLLNLFSLSPITHGSSSSSSSPTLRSPLASSLTRSVFHSELKTWLFGKSFPPQTVFFPTGLIPWTLGHLMFLFYSAAGFVCMVCQTKSVFERTLTHCTFISFIHFTRPNSHYCYVYYQNS